MSLITALLQHRLYLCLQPSQAGCFSPSLQPVLSLFRSLLLPCYIDYHFHAWSAAYVLAVQEFTVAFSDYQFDAWFAAYALAVQDSAVRLLHYPLLAWLAVYAVASREVPAVF